MKQSTYLHADEVSNSIRAAERIVPIILNAVGSVTSVVDIGGGTGVWLQLFQQYGVTKIQLYDAPAVENELLINREFFQPVNFNLEMPELSRFDLAVCLECAEHLRPDRALPLIEWLTSAADMVVFSAAIPGQGGKGHINEQYSAYWSSLFHRYNFIQRDVLRGNIIHDPNVPWWYRQNLFLFTRPTVKLAIQNQNFVSEEFELIHRNVLLTHQQSFRFLLPQIRKSFVAAISRRLRL